MKLEGLKKEHFKIYINSSYKIPDHYQKSESYCVTNAARQSKRHLKMALRCYKEMYGRYNKILFFARTNKSNSACRPLIDKLYVTELRSKRFFTVSFLPLAAK